MTAASPKTKFLDEKHSQGEMYFDDLYVGYTVTTDNNLITILLATILSTFSLVLLAMTVVLFCCIMHHRMAKRNRSVMLMKRLSGTTGNNTLDLQQIARIGYYYSHERNDGMNSLERSVVVRLASDQDETFPIPEGPDCSDHGAINNGDTYALSSNDLPGIEDSLVSNSKSFNPAVHRLKLDSITSDGYASIKLVSEASIAQEQEALDLLSSKTLNKKRKSDSLTPDGYVAVNRTALAFTMHKDGASDIMSPSEARRKSDSLTSDGYVAVHHDALAHKDEASDIISPSEAPHPRSKSDSLTPDGYVAVHHDTLAHKDEAADIMSPPRSRSKSDSLTSDGYVSVDRIAKALHERETKGPEYHHGFRLRSKSNSLTSDGYVAVGRSAKAYHESVFLTTKKSFLSDKSDSTISDSYEEIDLGIDGKPQSCEWSSQRVKKVSFQSDKSDLTTSDSYEDIDLGIDGKPQSCEWSSQRVKKVSFQSDKSDSTTSDSYEEIDLGIDGKPQSCEWSSQHVKRVSFQNDKSDSTISDSYNDIVLDINNTPIDKTSSMPSARENDQRSTLESDATVEELTKALPPIKEEDFMRDESESCSPSSDNTEDIEFNFGPWGFSKREKFRKTKSASVFSENHEDVEPYLKGVSSLQENYQEDPSQAKRDTDAYQYDKRSITAPTLQYK